MLYSTLTPAQKRQALRESIAARELTVLPGAFNPLSARLIEQQGFGGVYVSGHMIAADLGLPDLGMTTATEVATRAQQIARMTDLPTVVDADTGFGEPLNIARTVQTLEDAGLAGCHIEDQVNPKRCGHTDGVEVVDPERAVLRIRAAVAARRDASFVLIARTDARAPLGLDAAIERAHAYLAAGADVIFPDALAPAELRRFRAAVDAPLLVNLNEFGRGNPPTQAQAHELGIDICLYPMTLMRSAMGAAGRTLRALRDNGSQHAEMARMQPATELYELLGNDTYLAFDSAVLQP